MSECEHQFHCDVSVAIFEDKPGQGAIDVKGACTKCGAPLVFYGQRGAGGNSPMASADRKELRAPVTFGHEVSFIPGPDAVFNGPELVKALH
jgi:hypothetical protein